MRLMMITNRSAEDLRPEVRRRRSIKMMRYSSLRARAENSSREATKGEVLRSSESYSSTKKTQPQMTSNVQSNTSLLA